MILNILKNILNYLLKNYQLIFFFYYNSSKISEIISKNFKLIDNNNHFFKYFKKNIDYFKNEYKKNSLKYFEFYEYDNTFKTKFNYKIKNILFYNFINDIKSLNNL